MLRLLPVRAAVFPLLLARAVPVPQVQEGQAEFLRLRQEMVALGILKLPVAGLPLTQELVEQAYQMVLQEAQEAHTLSPAGPVVLELELAQAEQEARLLLPAEPEAREDHRAAA